MAFALRHFSEDDVPKLLRAAARAAEARAQAKLFAREATALTRGAISDSVPYGTEIPALASA